MQLKRYNCFLYRQNILGFIICFLVLNSCVTEMGYYKHHQRRFIFEPIYNHSDTLIMSNYVLYGNSFRHSKNHKVEHNDDSLFNILKGSFSKLAIPLINDTPYINKTSEEFENNIYQKYNKNFENAILNLAAEGNKDNWQLIPVVTFNYHIYHIAGYNLLTDLLISLFIVHQNEIKYYKHLRYPHSESIDGSPPKEAHSWLPIPQEHWDGIVKDVMKEYIERLK